MKKNFIYSMLYEIVIAFYPILMVPYVSHTLGKSGLGIYSYTYAILGFFLLICQLGVNLCGTRAIAQSRDDARLMTKRFKSIFAIQLMASVGSIVAYISFIELSGSEYRIYFYLLLPFLIGQAIRISWFYLGIEEVKTIFIRNVLIRIISAAGIILFVRAEEDLPLYFIIMGSSYLLGDLSTWPSALKRLVKEPFSWQETKEYVLPMIKMFLPLLALKGAYYIDEIMLGTIHETDSVAVYENTYKVINMPLQLYTVFSNVLTAQASHLVANNKVKKNMQYIINSIDFSSVLMIPIIAGLMTIAPEFIPWYMGAQFIESVDLMKILPIVLIFSGITSILRTQYFVPMEMDNKYISSILLGVIINICLNAILIPLYGSLGAACGTVVSELVICVISVRVVNKDYSILQSFRYFPLYIGSSGILGLIVRFLGSRLGVGLITNVIQIIVGGIVYVALVLGIQMMIFRKDEMSLYNILINYISKYLNKISKRKIEK